MELHPINLISDIQTYLNHHEHYLLENYNNYFTLNKITQITYNNFTPDITNLTFMFDIILFFTYNVNQNQINETKDYFLNYFNDLLKDKIYNENQSKYNFIIPLNENNIFVDLYVNPETNIKYSNSMYIRIILKIEVLPNLNDDVIELIMKKLNNPFKLLGMSKLYIKIHII